MRYVVFAVLAAALAACGGGGTAALPPPGGGTVTPAPDPLDPAHVESRVLVVMEDPDDDDEVEELREDFAGLGIERIGATPFFVLTLPAGTDLATVLKDLDDDLRVVDSEPDYVGEAPEGGPSNTAILGGDIISAIPSQDAFRRLDLAAAHAVTTGAGVLVAVVDTGVDPNHPFLAGRLAPGGFDFIDQDADPTDERNFADDDGDGRVDEQYGHGTFIASLVLAVAPDAVILPVRVLDAEGFGTASTVAAGIFWAADAGARVINVSVDLPDASEIVKEAISYAQDRDALVVAAAGNAGAADIIFPARFGSVIGVAAVDGDGVATAFTNSGSGVSLAAPGLDLIGAVPGALDPAGTARWSGTSFAAPVVAGTAALVRSAFQGLDRQQVRARLENTAVDIDGLNPGLAGRLGRGLVQPAAALR